MNHLLRLLLLLCLLAPSAAFAQAVDKATANAYYKNCMAQSDPRLTPDSQSALCSCTAAQMTKSMTLQDMKDLGQQTPAGEAALNKMLLNVYAPCMTYPVQDLVNSQCANDPKIKAIGSAMSMDRLCGCMAKKTGDWYAVQGRGLMAQILARDPHITDIITPIMESRQFNDQAYANLRACLKGQ
jgi:hypothetical protein